MTVKAIRHHQSFAGRDADDAHAQYLRLTETEKQTMAGSLDLVENTLYAGMVVPCSIIGNKVQKAEFLIKPCSWCGAHLHLRGSCGECAAQAGHVYITTAVNPCTEQAGNIYLRAGTGGKVKLASNYLVRLESDNYIELCATECIILCSEVVSVLVNDFEVEAWSDINLESVDGAIELTGCSVDLNGNISLNGPVTVECDLISCCDGKFAALVLCHPFDRFLLRLKYEGDAGESTSPMIDVVGCKCDDFSDCTSLWDGVSTGEDHAKYCLCGGIHINVNGATRYIKFYEPLV